MFDTLIKNGLVVDGSGKAGFHADVGMKDDRIAFVGSVNGASAAKVIDAGGKVVCPGAVDCHSHADMSVFRHDHHRILEPLVRQGITTLIGGNCGISLAPIGEKNRQMIKDYIEAFTSFNFDDAIQWASMGEFLDTLEGRGVLLNTAILAPHGLIRGNEMGAVMRFATDEELHGMGNGLDRALEEGAIGLSTGLQYFPGNQSDTRELVYLGKVVKKHDGIFTSHLRSYSNTLDMAIDEVIEVAREAEIRAQISHIFWVPDAGWVSPYARKLIRGLARMSAWWTLPIPIDRPLAGRINRVAAAREKGIRVLADVMPTTTGFTHILAFFPPWVLADGGIEETLSRLRDPELRQKMKHSIEHGKMTWPHVEGDSWSLNLFRVMGWECARIMSVQTEKNKRLEGMSLMDIAKERKTHPFDAACDLLLEENGRVLVFESMAQPDDNFTERSTFGPIRHPEVAISTDTILMGFGKPSQLFYACYPKFISRYVRQKKMLSLETAVMKFTSLPAEHFKLKHRGLIKENYYADIQIFDPEKIASLSTFEKPDVFPAGIEHVFINGHHILEGDTFKPDPRPGMVLRGNR
ncbi:MAG: amidohydrolase family protein [bacterium]